MTKELCISRDVVVNEAKIWDCKFDCSSLKHKQVQVILGDVQNDEGEESASTHEFF